MKYWPSKTPTTVRDVGLDWGPTLSKIGKQLGIPDPTISISSWSRLRGDANVTAGTVHPNNRQTITRVSGGTAGTETIFRNTVTLSNGYVLDEDVFQRVRA